MIINKIHLEFEIVRIDRTIMLEGIPFSGIFYIKPFIDSVYLFDKNAFDGTFLYFDGLLQSNYGTGNYLLFTSVSGVADDAGWELIPVIHSKNNISWHFIREGEEFSATFSKENYQLEINKIKMSLKSNANLGYKLEPSHVIYPE